MSAQSQTLDVFRDRLPKDADLLNDMFSDLTLESGQSVSNDVRQKLAILYDRWSILNPNIRAPDYSSGSALANYLEYFLRMVENWLRTNGSKFNANLSALYAASGSLDSDLADLIAFGKSSTTPNIYAAANALESQVANWETSFPNASSQLQDNTSSIVRQTFSRWGLAARDALVMIKPSTKLFSAGYVSRRMTQALSVDLGLKPVFPGWPIVGASADPPVYGVLTDGTSIVISTYYYQSSAGTYTPNAAITSFATIPIGGFSFSGRLTNPMMYRMGNTTAGVIMNQQYTPRAVAATDLFTITYTDGTNTYTTSTTIDAVFTVYLPYSAGATWTIRITGNSTVVHPASGYSVTTLTFTPLNVTFSSLRPLVLRSTGGVIDVIPTVSDIIGTLVGDIFEDFIDNQLMDGWTLLRRYTAYQEGRGFPTIIDATKQAAVNLKIFANVAAATVIDYRILSLEWWFNYTNEATFTTNNKKNLYRQFYKCLEDFIIMASTDGAFQNSVLSG